MRDGDTLAYYLKVESPYFWFNLFYIATFTQSVDVDSAAFAWLGNLQITQPCKCGWVYVFGLCKGSNIK
jgi:hypothetical protein